VISNVVTLLGRGVEGCGVTKFTIELQKYLKKKGINNPVIALKDKTWSRKDSHELDCLQFKFAKDDQFKHAMDIINKADVVIVNSLPSAQVKKTVKAHDAKAVDNFLECISECKPPIIMIQHDHNKLSLRRNAGTEILVDRAAAIFAHSTTGHFAEQVASFSGGEGLETLFSPGRKIETFQPACNFDALFERYWCPVMAQDDKLCRWIGRTTFWKGFVPMFDLHNNYLRDAGFATVLEGIEKSPAYLDFKTKSVFVDMLANKDPDTVDMKDYRGKDAVVFSVYNNDAMLKRMAKTAFGFQLSLLDSKFIDKSIEYTHCEIPAVGALPVFRKEFGDACTHRVTGNRLTEDDSGTIWLPTNKSDMGQAFEIIKRLSEDPHERHAWRLKAFEYYKAHQDSQFVFDDLMRKIENAVHQ
jgi:hypothetical protein